MRMRLWNAAHLAVMFQFNPILTQFNVWYPTLYKQGAKIKCGSSSIKKQIDR